MRISGLIGLSVCLAVSITGAPSAALAFTATLTGAGTPVRWDPGFKFNLAGNPVNSSGISPQDFFKAVVRSLQRWQYASGGSVSFDYWQGTDPSIFEPNSNYNGLSSVYFASNANGNSGLTPNVLGLTQVWYNTSTGQIIEADTVLNDRNFVFTTNPTDTSGFGSETSNFSGKNKVFIENVLTHEFGHAFGLSHSGQLQSTMLFMESPEQAHLGCDEQVAIHDLYPTDDSGQRSGIIGTVLGPTGSPLLGVNVEAISVRRGTVLASAMTDRDGRYVISGLEPGKYILMAEPYYAGAGPLPAYYKGLNIQVCPDGSAFGRTVLADNSGYKAQQIDAPEGGTASAPTLTVRCDGGSAAIVAAPSSANDSSAPVIYDGLSDGTSFGVTDRFSDTGNHYYRLKNVSGHLEVRVLSYSLYSPVSLSVSLLDANGDEVSSAQVQMPVYVGDSGYENYDTTIIADDLPLGDYYIAASPTPMNATLYPAGPISRDPMPFAVFTGTLNEPNPPLSSVIPFNARCRMSESFPTYQSPPGLPPRNSTQTQVSGGGCGMIDFTGGSDGPSNGAGPQGPGAVGWFIPWILMGLIARLARRHARS